MIDRTEELKKRATLIAVLLGIFFLVILFTYTFGSSGGSSALLFFMILALMIPLPAAVLSVVALIKSLKDNMKGLTLVLGAEAALSIVAVVLAYTVMNGVMPR